MRGSFLQENLLIDSYYSSPIDAAKKRKNCLILILFRMFTVEFEDGVPGVLSFSEFDRLSFRVNVNRRSASPADGGRLTVLVEAAAGASVPLLETRGNDGILLRRTFDDGL